MCASIESVYVVGWLAGGVLICVCCARAENCALQVTKLCQKVCVSVRTVRRVCSAICRMRVRAYCLVVPKRDGQELCDKRVRVRWSVRIMRDTVQCSAAGGVIHFRKETSMDYDVTSNLPLTFKFFFF